MNILHAQTKGRHNADPDSFTHSCSSIRIQSRSSQTGRGLLSKSQHDRNWGTSRKLWKGVRAGNRQG